MSCIHMTDVYMCYMYTCIPTSSHFKCGWFPATNVLPPSLLLPPPSPLPPPPSLPPSLLPPSPSLSPSLPPPSSFPPPPLSLPPSSLSPPPSSLPPSHRILQKLPSENQLFLRYLIPLLHHITDNEAANCMNSINLAICFAPSLLWPDSGLDVIKNEVPPLIQFMIEQSPMVFGHELPELYQVEGVLSPSPRSYRVPTKKTDGNMRMYRHRRTGSMDTSTSEDSAGEDDMPSNLLLMQRSGLTVSDSQVSVRSHTMEDEEYDPAIVQSSGNVLFAAGHERFRNQLNPHSPKRPKKYHPPERSSSYRGPNERPPYVQKYHVKNQDEASRRKSIATQTTLQQGSKPLYPTSSMQLISPSPNASVSSSSHSQEVPPFIKSHQMQSFDENEEYIDEDMLEIGRRATQKRKRLPYRQAFSVDPLMQTTENPSYYDHLPPLSPEEGGVSVHSRDRPISTTILGAQGDSFSTAMEEDEDDPRWIQPPLASGDTPLHPAHPILSSSDRSLPGTHASNQSITSRSSTSSGGHYYSTNQKLPQSRPSNLSLVSSVSESSYTSTVNKGSPESERTPLSREMVKYEITRRFKIPSRGNSFTGKPYSSSAAGRSDSFNQEMDNIQRKFQERRRPKALNSIPASTRTGMESVSSPPSFDDRPESERHLNSFLSTAQAESVQSPPPPVRQAAGYRRINATERREQERDPIKLFVENNSDTESSPSRTLTRREKLNETNPMGVSVRYHSGPAVRQLSNIGRTTFGAHGRSSRHPPLNEVSIIPAKNDEESTKADAESKAAQTQSLSPQPSSSEQKSANLVVEPTPTIRPKSAQGTGTYRGNEVEFLERTMSDVEKAKLKLGLIPPRRRSKSISETRSTKALLKDDEEKQELEPESQDELEVNETSEVRLETQKVDKRGIWRAHAPSSNDRKEAYAQRVKGGSVHDNPSHTAKSSAPNVPPAIYRTATAPEVRMKRRAATMPEYLATRTAALGRTGRVLGKGMVRTVKITAYDVPEPRRIHRINLRMFH